MKYSSQIVIKKLDNKIIFYPKNNNNNLTDIFKSGKFDTKELTNVEWIDNKSLVKKHYQRKGLMSIFKDFYLYSSIKKTRPFRECEILHYLICSNFNTCKPLIGWVEYLGGIFYKANLVTENIVGMNFCDFLKSQNIVESKMIETYKKIGSATAEMHKLSIFHGDLNINNIIISKNNYEVHIIDFDKSYYKILSVKDRERNLQRLRRSLVKNNFFNQGHFDYFLDSYYSSIKNL